ncbi:hypothetical protein [Streptomyces sp. NPDC059575]|uniref:hypothetical protein n=1 Tax=Streptomyces sp. NPDC059575 TaxID=3346872 RepID=UPI003676DC00
MPPRQTQDTPGVRIPKTSPKSLIWKVLRSIAPQLVRECGGPHNLEEMTQTVHQFVFDWSQFASWAHHFFH